MLSDKTFNKYKYADEILDLIDSREDFTRSDLQGIVEALVMKIWDHK